MTKGSLSDMQLMEVPFLRMNPRISLFSLGALLAVAGSCFLHFAEARTWTSTDGKPLQAIFLGIEGESLKFRLQNGNEIVVPKDRFIKADQEAA